MRLRVTHVLRYQLDGLAAADAVALPADPVPDNLPGQAASAGRLFLPGILPCGECPACRRGLVAICSARQAPLEGPGPDAIVDVPDRFITPIDDPPELGPLDSAVALLAGPVALAQQALALASAAPGDVAVWLGGDPLAQLGASVAAARGLKTLESTDTPAGPHAGRAQRHLVVTRSDPATWQQARALAAPGGTLTLLGPGPLRLPAIELPPELRLLRTGAYHPDLVPESLALLRREQEEFKKHLNSSGPASFELV